jgi:hypothetical protein
MESDDISIVVLQLAFVGPVETAQTNCQLWKLIVFKVRL